MKFEMGTGQRLPQGSIQQIPDLPADVTEAEVIALFADLGIILTPDQFSLRNNFSKSSVKLSLNPLQVACLLRWRFEAVGEKRAFTIKPWAAEPSLKIERNERAGLPATDQPVDDTWPPTGMTRR